MGSHRRTDAARGRNAAAERLAVTEKNRVDREPDFEVK